MKKKKSKKDIEEEIDVINAFGVGMGVTLIFLASYLYFGLNPVKIIYPILFIFGTIFIRSIYLKIKLRKN